MKGKDRRTSRIATTGGIGLLIAILVALPLSGMASALLIEEVAEPLPTPTPLPWPTPFPEELQPIADQVAELLLGPSEPPPPDPSPTPSPDPSEGGEIVDPPKDRSNPSGPSLPGVTRPSGPAINAGAPLDAAAAYLDGNSSLNVDAGPTSAVGRGFYWPSGPGSTFKVLSLLESLGLAQGEIAKVLAPFPVAGPAVYSDDWGAPRDIPFFHLHEGTDIFAERGTPVIASASGFVSNKSDVGMGGNSLRVTGQDRTHYYYAHLDGFAPLISEGGFVTQGQVLGYVGTTGNAEGGLPHLHFEIHPNGGAAIPPVPFLDRWLDEAYAAALTLRDSHVTEIVRPNVPVRQTLFGGAVDTIRSVSQAGASVYPAGTSTAVWAGMAGAAALAWLHHRRRVSALLG